MCEFKDSNYIIIGDWNCHFNSDFGPRCWNINSCSSHSASQVIEFLQRCSLIMIDTTEKCQGPNYTYRHEMGHISYIDHCALSASLVNSVKQYVLYFRMK